MAFRLRVLLSPIGPQPAAVTGLRVRLHQFGAGTTLALRDSPQPAQFIFTVTLLKSIRRPAEKLEKRLATLTAQVSLSSSTRAPLVDLSRDEVGRLTGLLHDEPLSEPASAEGSRPRRRLTLRFDESQFPGVSTSADLLLPPETDDGFRFGEVRVALEIAGQEEAPASVNDVLDFPLLETTPPFIPPPLIVSVYVGEKFPNLAGDVVVETGTTVVQAFPIKDLPLGDPGYAFLELDTMTLPDPVTIRRVSDEEDVTLVGPCSLKELSGALKTEEFEQAGSMGYSTAVRS